MNQLFIHLLPPTILYAPISAHLLQVQIPISLTSLTSLTSLAFPQFNGCRLWGEIPIWHPILSASVTTMEPALFASNEPGFWVKSRQKIAVML